MKTTITIKRLNHNDGDDALPLPRYETPGAAGMDLAAAVTEAVTLAPGERRLIPTGLAMAIPSGYEVQIRPRSGLAFKHGVTVLNAPGTIDSDYRGEVQVLLVNLGGEPFTVTRGMRVAQMVVAAVAQGEIAEGEPDETVRGRGGFGSTGVSGGTA